MSKLFVWKNHIGKKFLKLTRRKEKWKMPLINHKNICTIGAQGVRKKYPRENSRCSHAATINKVLSNGKKP